MGSGAVNPGLGLSDCDRNHPTSLAKAVLLTKRGEDTILMAQAGRESSWHRVVLRAFDNLQGAGAGRGSGAHSHAHHSYVARVLAS